MEKLCFMLLHRPLVILKTKRRKRISYFSTKAYVVGTQKNRLNETVLFSSSNICLNLWVRKYLQFYAVNLCLSKPMVVFAISLNNRFLQVTMKI